MIGYRDRHQWLGMGVLALVGLSVGVNQASWRASLERQTGGMSAGFRKWGEEDPLRQPRDEEIQLIPEGKIPFELELPANYQGERLMEITFVYRCSDCLPLWLSGGDRRDLVHHPLLENFDWFYLEDRGLALYQPVVVAQSISDLTKPGIHIVTERGLVDYLGLSQVKNVQFLDDVDVLPGEVDVVVTSRMPVGKLGEWYKYRSLWVVADVFDGGRGVYELEHAGAPYEMAFFSGRVLAD